MNKYFTNDEDRLEVEENSCAYIGHLKKDMEACVAMTGCFGQEPVEFSVISDRVEDSGAYVWNLDGNCNCLRESPRTNIIKPSFI